MIKALSICQGLPLTCEFEFTPPDLVIGIGRGEKGVQTDNVRETLFTTVIAYTAHAAANELSMPSIMPSGRGQARINSARPSSRAG